MKRATGRVRHFSTTIGTQPPAFHDLDSVFLSRGVFLWVSVPLWPLTCAGVGSVTGNRAGFKPQAEAETFHALGSF